VTRARGVAAGLALLVLVLVAVLVGLLGQGGPGSATAPARTSAAATSRPASPAIGGRDAETNLRVVALATLPREARQTVALIEDGGPFPYAQDGATFANRERLLPAHPRGWYREYTVRTPGEQDRGPRRIVTGDDDRLIFYTPDHYASFVRVAR
jgi:ribonuclease T1